MTKKVKPFKKYPLVCVDWYDHSGDAGWVELKELEEPPIRCRTIGFKVAENDTSLHIFSTITNDDGHGGNNEVLKSCIISETVIRKRF